MDLAEISVRMLAASFLTFIAGGMALAQPASSAPPAVGIVEAIKRPITESSEFLGRIEAVNRGQYRGSRHRVSGTATVRRRCRA
ncbi:multidrug efflux pump subunit AcrA (membrane-fusion protein) [Bradyrhizobium sp. LM6.11]